MRFQCSSCTWLKSTRARHWRTRLNPGDTKPLALVVQRRQKPGQTQESRVGNQRQNYVMPHSPRENAKPLSGGPGTQFICRKVHEGGRDDEENKYSDSEDADPLV